MLLEAFRRKEVPIAVIGLGYVGLPVACKFAQAGFEVRGIERNAEKVEQIRQGLSPIGGKEPGLAELLAEVVRRGRLHVTSDYAACRPARAVLIAVETPVDEITHRPAYTALHAALESLGPHLSRGTLVVVESTIAPGTMAGLVQPVLEQSSGLRAGEDLYLAHCPERVTPGKLLHNLEHLPRVVGGMTPQAAALAVELYRHIVRADLDATDALTAEIVKTAENAYRDVQIAFANEVALLCESLGADVWRVRELVNKCPYRDMHLPGAGVGGHCLPKDPWLLIAQAPPAFRPRLIPAARAVNEGMPLHVAELVVDGLREAGKDVQGARVAVLGYAFLENSDDTRHSPSAVLVERLQTLGAEVVVHDPHVPEYQGDLRERLRGCDAAVVMVRHEEYLRLDPEELAGLLAPPPVVVDGRHVFTPDAARWIYGGVGVPWSRTTRKQPDC
ncbi:MAG: nucleotide sugar dehydrogenase [Chloroflexia bacterium]